MATLLGQASGGFTESSSALEVLHAGVFNAVGVLTDDAFTQNNPPTVAVNITNQVDQTLNGVLSGSVAFARGDAGGGANFIGGPPAVGQAAAVLGVFLNSANGNSFENTPGTASGKNTYMSSQGTYANRLFEDKNLASGAALTYACSDRLWASQNGFLTNVAADNNRWEQAAGGFLTAIGVLKMPPDSTQNFLVYDQRI